MLARLRLLLLRFWLACLAAPTVQAVTVVIVSSERSPAYVQAADDLGART